MPLETGKISFDRQFLIAHLQSIGTQETIKAAEMLTADSEELSKAQRKYLDFSELAQRRIDKLTSALAVAQA